MKFYKLAVIALTFVLFSCGGGGSGSTSDTDVTPAALTVTPSAELYDASTVYLPGQVILIESSKSFAKGEVVQMTTEDGDVIDIIGIPDGRGALTVPVDAKSGIYTLTIVDGDQTTNFTIEVGSVTFPLNPHLYIADFIADVITDIEAEIALTSGTPDPSLSSLLADLEGFDVDALSDADTDRLSKLIFTNAEALLDTLGVAPASVGSVAIASASVRAALRSFPECPAAKPFVRSVIATGAAVGLVALSVEFPLLFVASGAVLYKTAKVSRIRMNTVLDDCVGPVVNSLLASLRSVRLSSIVTAQSTEVARTVYRAVAIQSPAFDFFDGDSTTLDISITVLPFEGVQSAVDTLQSVVNSISFVVPNNVLSLINGLDAPTKKNITDEVTLQQFSGPLASCSGTVADYTCGFPDDNAIHDAPVAFTFNVIHPKYDEPFIQSANLLPRDIPVIKDQAFNVVIGTGEVNRVVIQVTEDTSSPNYELTKVTEYEVVTRPVWGDISNEFNEPGVIDYAADIANGMPDSEQFQVRVKNKYGWSARATITLNFSDNTTLQGRLPTTPGGTYYQAYYDPVANLTWLANANRGAMTWNEAYTWADQLNIDGVTGWRLPETLQPDSSCEEQINGLSFGTGCTGSEMGNLFYNVLGGTASESILTTHNANFYLFSNIQIPYWSATTIGVRAYLFGMGIGGQSYALRDNETNFRFYAWAVHSGDVGAP